MKLFKNIHNRYLHVVPINIGIVSTSVLKETLKQVQGDVQIFIETESLALKCIVSTNELKQ